jgi:myo-inositol-1(or 4)-monophosphatase
MRVRSCAALSDAVLYTTSPRLMQTDEQAAFAKVEDAVRLSRYGGDCYAYCMLAAGHIDLVIETGLKPYDIMALIPIIVGAGGIVTDWNDRPVQNGGCIVAAGDARVHRAALDLLNSAPATSRNQ